MKGTNSMTREAWADTDTSNSGYLSQGRETVYSSTYCFCNKLNQNLTKHSTATGVKVDEVRKQCFLNAR